MTQKPATDEPNPDLSAQEANETAPREATPETQLAQAEAERDDLKDKLLRTLADMENLRRRTEREIADAKAYAVTSFARDMLGSADNLRRALESVPDVARGDGEAALKALIEGVELTERDLLKTLERHGVRRIDPQGEKFDPNLHQAMFEAPDPTVAKGMVSKVVQSGYKIGERVLRPALVGVSAGAPKSEAPSGDADNGSTSSN
ncbi:nucleotide exchange factor GrpE [Bosea sp. (in: a-proteobacteria)]|jgi:molecular chaperone GrpE|uniref:nucleotide exchange factor GrpE n=1 Tax=Bosea sp. (in: a-proteobacteria) TaxID=1871050 RepID=UPI003F7213E0